MRELSQVSTLTDDGCNQSDTRITQGRTYSEEDQEKLKDKAYLKRVVSIILFLPLSPFPFSAHFCMINDRSRKKITKNLKNRRISKIVLRHSWILQRTAA